MLNYLDKKFHHHYWLRTYCSCLWTIFNCWPLVMKNTTRTNLPKICQKSWTFNITYESALTKIFCMHSSTLFTSSLYLNFYILYKKSATKSSLCVLKQVLFLFRFTLRRAQSVLNAAVPSSWPTPSGPMRDRWRHCKKKSPSAFKETRMGSAFRMYVHGIRITTFECNDSVLRVWTHSGKILC